MASTYPTSLDTFTNPSAGASLSSPSHSAQHGDVNDAVEAIEAKLGIGASPASGAVNGAVLVANGSGTTTYSSTGYGVYTAVTPTFTNVTVGNGTTVARYATMNKQVHYWGKFTLGTTSAITGLIGLTLPTTAHASLVDMILGVATLRDTGLNTYTGNAIATTTGRVDIYAANVGGGFETNTATAFNIPMTWVSTDFFAWNFVYEIA